jgi:FemAB-related protein (PEP-CTERM system-associated)
MNPHSPKAVSNVMDRPVSSASCTPVIRHFEASDAERWDRFVYLQPHGTFFHLSGWKRVIEKTFNYESCYLYAERNGEISGVAPLFAVSNWLVGRALISVPLAVYGGICAADPESEQVLLEQAKKSAQTRQVDFLELRYREKEPLAGFHRKTLYTTFRTELLPNPEQNFKCLPRDTRYMIRKGQKGGLRSGLGLDRLGEFYRLFTLSMSRLGTPVFPVALFENLAEEFERCMELRMIYADSQAVAGVLSFFFRDTVLPYYAGAGPMASRYGANNFMYWDLMKDAALAGFRQFDFGRSKKGTGAYAFKKAWNMREEPLDYQVYLVKRKTVPNFSPANPKFEIATCVWKRLPLWLANWMGPRVVRWFP